MIYADIVKVDENDYELTICRLAFQVLPAVGSELVIKQSFETEYLITAIKHRAVFFDRYDYANPPEALIKIYVREIQ